MTKPSLPATSSLKPARSAGASSGSASRQASGRTPATRLTPPIVVRGSRSAAIARTRLVVGFPSEASNSRYACAAVPSAKMPPCGLRVAAMRLLTRNGERMQASSGPRAKPGRIRPAVGLAARDQQLRGDGAEQEAADVREERDSAAVRARVEQSEVRLVQLVEEPEAEEEVGRDAQRNDSDEAEDARVRIEHEEGAEDRSDRAARAEVRHARVGRTPCEQRHRRLQNGRGETAGEVEEEVTKTAEGVLDVFSKHGEEQHVAEDVTPASVKEHRRDPADRQRLGSVAGAVDRTRIERCVVDSRPEMR